MAQVPQQSISAGDCWLLDALDTQRIEYPPSRTLIIIRRTDNIGAVGTLHTRYTQKRHLQPNLQAGEQPVRHMRISDTGLK